MAITAKFKVSRVADMDWAHEIELTPDYAQGRNAEWAQATPAGMIRMTVRNAGPERASIDVLPTLWFRNRWSWDPGGFAVSGKTRSR